MSFSDFLFLHTRLHTKFHLPGQRLRTDYTCQDTCLEIPGASARKILADGGDQGSLGDWVARKFGWVVEVVLRPDECPSKFQVLPKRWIVERTFSWLENFRRLTIDYEFLAETAEAMVQLACVQIMLNKFLYDFKTVSSYY